MKNIDPEKFKKAVKELERKASVVREAISIVESTTLKRAKRRKNRKGKIASKTK